MKKVDTRDESITEQAQANVSAALTVLLAVEWAWAAAWKRLEKIGKDWKTFIQFDVSKILTFHGIQ